MNPYCSHSWELTDFVDDIASSVSVKFKTLRSFANVYQEHCVPEYVPRRLIIQRDPELVQSCLDVIHVEAIFDISPYIFDISSRKRMVDKSIRIQEGIVCSSHLATSLIQIIE